MFRDKEPGRRDLKHFRNKVQYHSLNFLHSPFICLFLSFFFVCQSWRCIDILWIYYVLNGLTFCLVLPFDLNKHFVLNYNGLWCELLCKIEHNYTNIHLSIDTYTWISKVNTWLVFCLSTSFWQSSNKTSLNWKANSVHTKLHMINHYPLLYPKSILCGSSWQLQIRCKQVATLLPDTDYALKNSTTLPPEVVWKNYTWP